MRKVNESAEKYHVTWYKMTRLTVNMQKNNVKIKLGQTQSSLKKISLLRVEG